VLSRQTEEILAAVSLRDGVDYGAQCFAHIVAASGAAPKDARFAPYPHAAWSVPPIIWGMLIAESGQRKTAIAKTAFRPLQRIHNAHRRDYTDELKRWKALPPNERYADDKPEEPHSYIVNDCTVEKLQLILSANPRGTLLLKDEFAGFLEFGRYTKGFGAAERAFYLESYDGGPFTVQRVSRDSLHIPISALTIFGSIQPDRLSEFTGLDRDGLLQRFAVIRAAPAGLSNPDAIVSNEALLDQAIEQLAQLRGREYSKTVEGAELIRQTEREAAKFAAISDYGVGFQGFCRKLHSTHARIALILHLVEDPDRICIATETVARAYLLTHRFLLPHALNFYSVISGSAALLQREIGGWLLTKAKHRLVASDLTSGVKACRGMGLKEVAKALDPFVTGGWLNAEDPYPSNKAWIFEPNVRAAFADRAEFESVRRAEIRKQIGRINRDVP
jgi:hypothetical protein